MLRNLPQSEFPSDYLVPRLLARKAATTATLQACLDGKEVLPWSTDQEIARQLLAERFWLYRQLNSRLRQSLSPVFLFFELETLINWLRARKARATNSQLHFFLDYSLFCSEVRKALQEEEDAQLLAVRLDKLLCTHLDRHFSGIAENYQKNGLLDFERSLYQLFFEYRGVSALEPAVRFFFRSLVDLRNLLTLAKIHYWQDTGQEKAIIRASGHMNVNWKRAINNPNLAAKILASTHWQSGLPTDGRELSALEDFLLRRHDLVLHRQASRGVAEQILYYLWRQKLLARNMGLLLHRLLIGEEIIEAKILP